MAAWADAVPSPVQVSLAEPRRTRRSGRRGGRERQPDVRRRDPRDDGPLGRGRGVGSRSTARNGRAPSASGRSARRVGLVALRPPARGPAPRARRSPRQGTSFEYHDGAGRVWKFFPPCEGGAPLCPGYELPPPTQPGGFATRCPPGYEPDFAEDPSALGEPELARDVPDLLRARRALPAPPPARRRQGMAPPRPRARHLDVRQGRAPHRGLRPAPARRDQGGRAGQHADAVVRPLRDAPLCGRRAGTALHVHVRRPAARLRRRQRPRLVRPPDEDRGLSPGGRSATVRRRKAAREAVARPVENPSVAGFQLRPEVRYNYARRAFPVARGASPRGLLEAEARQLQPAGLASSVGDFRPRPARRPPNA